MKKTLHQLLKSVFMIAAFLFASITSVGAQDVSSAEPKNIEGTVGTVPANTTVGEELNKSNPDFKVQPNLDSKKKYYDNGFVKFELTGDPEKDRQQLKDASEKLKSSNPKQYKEMMEAITPKISPVSAQPDSKQ